MNRVLLEILHESEVASDIFIMWSWDVPLGPQLHSTERTAALWAREDAFCEWLAAAVGPEPTAVQLRELRSQMFAAIGPGVKNIVGAGRKSRLNDRRAQAAAIAEAERIIGGQG